MAIGGEVRITFKKDHHFWNLVLSDRGTNPNLPCPRLTVSHDACVVIAIESWPCECNESNYSTSQIIWKFIEKRRKRSCYKKFNCVVFASIEWLTGKEMNSDFSFIFFLELTTLVSTILSSLFGVDGFHNRPFAI